MVFGDTKKPDCLYPIKVATKLNKPLLILEWHRWAAIPSPTQLRRWLTQTQTKLNRSNSDRKALRTLYIAGNQEDWRHRGIYNAVKKFLLLALTEPLELTTATPPSSSNSEDDKLSNSDGHHHHHHRHQQHQKRFFSSLSVAVVSFRCSDRSPFRLSVTRPNVCHSNLRLLNLK